MFDARTQNDPVSQKLFQIEPMPGANRHAAKMTAKCEECGMTKSLYVNLTDGRILCARIPLGKGHSLKNYENNKKNHTALSLDAVIFGPKIQLRSGIELSAWNYEYNDWLRNTPQIRTKVEQLLHYWFPSHVPSLRYQCAKLIQKEIARFAKDVSERVPYELREYVQNLPPHENPPE